jgi:metal-responsive CopG/Arc/MetJ family transcriptional regulator
VTVRYNVSLSDSLNEELDRAAEETETTKSDVFRKALQLYLAARDGKRKGLTIGLVEPESKVMQTEFIGL